MEGQGNNHNSINSRSININGFDLNEVPSEVEDVGKTAEGSSSSGFDSNKRKAPEEGASGVNPGAHLGLMREDENPDDVQLVDIYDFFNSPANTDRNTRLRTSRDVESSQNTRPRTSRDVESGQTESTSFLGPVMMSRDIGVQSPPSIPSPSGHSTISNGQGGSSVGVQFPIPSHVGIQIPVPTAQHNFVRPLHNSFELGVQQPQHGLAYQPPSSQLFPYLNDYAGRPATSNYHPAGSIFAFGASTSRSVSLVGYNGHSFQSLLMRGRVQTLRSPSWHPTTVPLASAVPQALFATPEEAAFEAELIRVAELFRQLQEQEFFDEEEILNAGLSEETILAHLQQRRYPARTPESDVESCCICLDEYMEGHELGTLDCGHEFHFQCIKLWLEEKNTCPLCKRTGLAE